MWTKPAIFVFQLIGFFCFLLGLLLLFLRAVSPGFLLLAIAAGILIKGGRELRRRL